MTRREERGGALLEALIALGITAMLAAAVSQTGRFGLSMIERADAAAQTSGALLAERRRLADLLSRIDAETPGRPVFAGDAAAMRWRGVAPDDAGGWRAGVWRLTAAEDALILSRCEAMDDAPCAEEARFAPAGPFAYAGPDGAFAGDWPAGAAPALIRLGDDGLTAQPRVSGALR